MAETTTDILIVRGGPAKMMTGIIAVQFSPHKGVHIHTGAGVEALLPDASGRDRLSGGGRGHGDLLPDHLRRRHYEPLHPCITGAPHA